MDAIGLLLAILLVSLALSLAAYLIFDIDC
jgi:hypothetical protein